jgi:hypothetical protein
VKVKKTLLIFSMALKTVIYAQHDHHQHSERDSTDSKKFEMPPMSHAFSLNLPMTRNGSGTGWLPDSTPMYGYMIHHRKWMYMAHGNLFVRYNKQDVFNKGSRGGDKFDAVNWFMAMGQRRVAKNGLFRFNIMLSLDNLFGGNGYPLLFQTGESWQGKPIVDRQHPHDLFSELSVSYSQAINKKTDLFLYVGYPGEPALGSVAFMHRVSSLYCPDAPLSHHWNDGTHITFGVVTGGVRFGKFKIDGSIFTGREPDENRYNFDKPRFDSYSGRISFNPNPYWSFQASQGFIKSPEATRPTENVYRTTASAVFSKPLQKSHFLNATILWGLNSGQRNENAILAEAVLVLNRLAFYGRYELVQKSSEELDLNKEQYFTTTVFNINATTLGIGYDLVKTKTLRIAIGAQGTYYSADSRLNYLYGKNPMAAETYVRIYPPRMRIR